MENNLEVIPIFFAVDDGYIPFLAVALESLIDNASKEYYYSIKILYTNINEENKRKINKYKCENVNIEFVDLNYYIEKVKDKLYTRDYYTKTTYFRLFIPNLYPQYNKAIYLDSDIVVLGDISELYNQEIENNLVAAAPDDVIQSTKVFQEYAEKVVGVADYRNYFNAGILLMNLDEFRKFKFQEKFLYLLETIKFTVAQDQDYLNRLSKGKVKIIDKAWDKMPIANDNFDENNLKIIHYNLAYKPWHYDNIKYKEYFWKYAKETEYYDDICKIKDEYTEEERFNDMQQYKALKELAQKESDCVGDDRNYRRNIIMIEKSKETYYEALQDCSTEWHESNNTYEPFVKYYLGILIKASNEFESRVEYLSDNKISKSERVKRLIQNTVGKINKKEILEKCPDISTKTVERALADLVKEGLIEKVGASSATAYIWIEK